jgi:hypothetical protein
LAVERVVAWYLFVVEQAALYWLDCSWGLLILAVVQAVLLAIPGYPYFFRRAFLRPSNSPLLMERVLLHPDHFFAPADGISPTDYLQDVVPVCYFL